MNVKEKELADKLKQRWAGPMTEAEIEFLRDVQGLIDFAFRNGLSFQTVMAPLIHDMNEIAKSGFDYGKARDRNFLPAVTGYSKLTSDSFGESEEEQAVTQ